MGGLVAGALVEDPVAIGDGADSDGVLAGELRVGAGHRRVDAAGVDEWHAGLHGHLLPLDEPLAVDLQPLLLLPQPRGAAVGGGVGEDDRRGLSGPLRVGRAHHERRAWRGVDAELEVRIKLIHLLAERSATLPPVLDLEGVELIVQPLLVEPRLARVGRKLRKHDPLRLCEARHDLVIVGEIVEVAGLGLRRVVLVVEEDAHQVLVRSADAGVLQHVLRRPRPELVGVRAPERLLLAVRPQQQLAVSLRPGLGGEAPAHPWEVVDAVLRAPLGDLAHHLEVLVAAARGEDVEAGLRRLAHHPLFGHPVVHRLHDLIHEDRQLDLAPKLLARDLTLRPATSRECRHQDQRRDRPDHQKRPPHRHDALPRTPLQPSAHRPRVPALHEVDAAGVLLEQPRVVLIATGHVRADVDRRLDAALNEVRDHLAGDRVHHHAAQH